MLLKGIARPAPRKLAGKLKRRKAVNEWYRRELQGVPEIEIPFKEFSHSPSYHVFPILLSDSIDRGLFMEKLKGKRIQTSIHYPPIHRFSYYKSLAGRRDTELKWTDYVGDHEVTLPLYPGLSRENVQYIARSIRSALQELGY